MKTAAHTFAPEEIMAFVDGELSGPEGQPVSAHLPRCAHCSAVAEEFRDTSRLLSEWRVPATATRLDGFEDELAAAAASRRALGGPVALASARRSNRKFWAMGGAGVLAAAVLLTILSFQPNREYVRSRHLSAMAASSDLSETKSYLAATSGPARSGERMESSTGLLASTHVPPPPAVALQGEVGTGSSTELSAPMIARRVFLVIQVKSVETARASVEGILARHHGYAAQLDVAGRESSANLEASLRIPAAELGAALAELRNLGWVQAESQSGEEVTQQHADLSARLNNSRETEERLRAILQQRTGSVADVLKVEEEIARVRGEIETMEGEQQGLEHRVDFASIELRLSEEYKAQLDASAGSVSTQMHNALVAGYQHASETLLGIVLLFEEYGPVLLIWLVILGVPGVLWLRYRRIRSRL